MKRLSKWLWFVLLVMAFGLLGASCAPETVEDDSDLPWATPEDWESGAPFGVGF